MSSIKLSKYNEYNENDIIFTIFTDSKDMYDSRLIELTEEHGEYSKEQANLDLQGSLFRQGIENIKELSYYDKKSIHNLKYFTWVEQQGKDVEELNAQWNDENYWPERFGIVPVWDKLIEEFNAKTGVTI